MKEVTFIRRNIEKWKETEKVVEKADKFNPDRLADAYTELTADLAFAQTHYPSSRITIYLNNLAFALHNVIYRNKREKWTRIITFWTQEVPQTMHDARKELLVSFLIFAASVVIGIISAWNDPNFVRLILGNGYVDMTLENIANGEPMAVYNGSEEMPMFLGITLNNIMVSFNCFAMGLLTSFGTGYMLLSNGIRHKGNIRYVANLNKGFQFSFIKSNEAFILSPKERFTYIATLAFCDSMLFSIW